METENVGTVKPHEELMPETAAGRCRGRTPLIAPREARRAAWRRWSCTKTFETVGSGCIVRGRKFGQTARRGE